MPKSHKMKLFSCFILTVLHMINLPGPATGALDCPGNRSQTYVIIPESDYDRDYTSEATGGKRPLGFQGAVWRYNQDDTPCYSISSGSSRSVEIRIDTFPSSRLCIKVLGQLKGCSDPGSGQFYLCQRFDSSTLSLEFTCDSQCAENDVQFFFRIVLGELSSNDQEGRWCDGRNRDEYPSNLQLMPPNVPLPPNSVTTTQRGVGSGQDVSYFLLLLVLAGYVFRLLIMPAISHVEL